MFPQYYIKKILNKKFVTLIEILTQNNEKLNIGICHEIVISVDAPICKCFEIF